MKSFNLTKKKKVWLFALALLALILLALVINIQLNQPEHMSADYVGLWKSRWHEEYLSCYSGSSSWFWSHDCIFQE